MPQVCTAVPLSVEVCTPSYGSAQSLRFLEWDAGLKLDVDPVVVHYPCDDLEARYARCDAERATSEGILAECQHDLRMLTQQHEQQTTMYRATQQRLAECRQREDAPDMSSAWVLGALALGGVVARWLR